MSQLCRMPFSCTNHDFDRGGRRRHFSDGVTGSRRTVRLTNLTAKSSLKMTVTSKCAGGCRRPGISAAGAGDRVPATGNFCKGHHGFLRVQQKLNANITTFSADPMSPKNHFTFCVFFCVRNQEKKNENITFPKFSTQLPTSLLPTTHHNTQHTGNQTHIQWHVKISAPIISSSLFDGA